MLRRAAPCGTACALAYAGRVSRWTQPWLSGAGEGAQQGYPGQRLGLPARGPGRAAAFGPRLGAIAVDWFPCLLIAELLTAHPPLWALVIFAALTVLSVAFGGRTLGHRVAGLRVARLDGGDPGLTAAVTRTLLLCVVIPPLVFDADWRGLHDRAADTIVLHTR